MGTLHMITFFAILATIFEQKKRRRVPGEVKPAVDNSLQLLYSQLVSNALT